MALDPRRQRCVDAIEIAKAAGLGEAAIAACMVTVQGQTQQRGGTLTGTAVLTAATGEVDLVIHATREGDTWRVLNLVAAGFPILPGPP